MRNPEPPETGISGNSVVQRTDLTGRRRELVAAFLTRPPWSHLTLFTIALVARLVFQYAVVGMNSPPQADAAQYDALAWNLARGEPYVAPDGARSRRAPVFPVFLAGIYRVAGHNYPWARTGQAVVGALTCCLVYALGRRAVGPLIGFVASLWCAVSPYGIFWSGELLSEPVCTLFVVAGLLALVRVDRGVGWLAAFSALCGLATLARPNIGLIWLLALPLAVRRGDHRFQRLTLCVLVYAAILAPWTYRNYLIHHRLVFVTTMGGEVLWEGNNPYVANDHGLRGRSANAEQLPEAALVRGRAEADIDRAYFQMAVRFLLDHPGDLPALLAAKFRRVWNVLPQVEGGLQRWVAVCHAVLMVALFAVGLVIGFRRRESFLLPMLLPALGVTLTALVYWGDARIRAPAEPAILIIATYGAVALLRGHLRASMELEDGPV